MRFSLRLAFPALIWTVASAIPAAAQDDLSVDDLVTLWGKQKQMFHEAEANPLGKTRGLELVTIDDPDSAAAVPAATTEALPDAGASISATIAATPEVATTDPNKPLTAGPETVQPVVFGQLAPELQVNLQINFGFDSAALADTEKPKLQKICDAMKQSDVKVFRIVGHTDNAGSDEYNERLSVLRADEVVRFLTDDCGITATRLEALGMGERFLFNATNPRADENRRVEFQAVS